MTYEEIKKRLNKCELALKELNKAQQPSQNKEQVEKLTLLKESLERQLAEFDQVELPAQPIAEKQEEESEEEVDFEGEDQDDVSSSNSLTLADTIVVSKKVGKALTVAIKRNGDEIQQAKAVDIEPGTFAVAITYPNDNTDSFKFVISQDSIILEHGDDRVNVGDVKIKTSGDVVVHEEIVADNIYKYFQILAEEKVEEEVQEENIPEIDPSDIEDYAKIKDFIKKQEQDDDIKTLKESVQSDSIAEMNQSIHAFLGEPSQMPSPLYEGLDLAARDAVDFYWGESDLFEQSQEQLAEIAKANYLKAYFAEQYNALKELFAIKEKGEYDDAIKKALAEAATKVEENRYKYYLEVPIKESVRAVELLDQEYANQYRLKESNVLAFDNLKTAHSALEDIQTLQISVLEENITENIHTPNDDVNPEFKSIVRKIVEGVGNKFKLSTWESLNEVNNALYYLKQDFKYSSDAEISEKESLMLEEANETPKEYVPGTLAQSINKLNEDIQALLPLVKKYDRKGGEIAFPYWMQQKVRIAEDYVRAVQEYMVFEDKKPGADLLTLQEESIQPFQHYTLKEMIKSVGRKPEEVYDLVQPKIVEGKGQGSLKLKGGDTVVFKKEYGLYSIVGGTLFEQIKSKAATTKVELYNIVKEVKQLAKQYEPSNKSMMAEIRKKAAYKKQIEEKYNKLNSLIDNA